MQQQKVDIRILDPDPVLSEGLFFFQVVSESDFEALFRIRVFTDERVRIHFFFLSRIGSRSGHSEPGFIECKGGVSLDCVTGSRLCRHLPPTNILQNFPLFCKILQSSVIGLATG